MINGRKDNNLLSIMHKIRTLRYLKKKLVEK